MAVPGAEGVHSFERRLRWGLTTMLVPVSLAAVLGLVGLVWVNVDQGHIREEISEQLAVVSELRGDLGRAARTVERYVATDEVAFRDEFVAVSARIDANLARVEEFDDAIEVTLGASAARAWDEAEVLAARLLAGTGDGAVDFASVFAAIESANGDLTSLDQVSRDELEATVRSSSTRTRWTILVTLLIGVATTTVNLWLARRLLVATSGPLRELTDGVDGFSVDDLEHRVALVGDREFRAVGQAFNGMADRLQGALGELEHQAFHDGLTGLPNRDNLLRLLQRPDQSGRAVLLVDLDGFKAINDGLGHAAGDEALVQIGHRMERALSQGDFVARLGGDEFAIVLGAAIPTADVEAVAQRVIASVAEPVEIAGRSIVLHASAGISLPTDGRQVEDALRQADIALYTAKDAGRDCVRVFRPEMLGDVERRLELETDLRRALDQGEIEVHYQPTVRAATGAVAGVEALARWRHPTLGYVPPATFIPVAEASGQILDVGRFVLETACRQAKAWQSRPGLDDLRVNVNVSASQLHDRVIVDHVSDALRTTGLAPASLTIEVTETVMADPEVVARIHEIKALGVRIALDDFGTGYSSLSYLQHLPIDILKIDKSFIDDLGSKVDRAVLARVIVQMGHVLGLETVAEGVETINQLRVLNTVGCDVVQGYLFARPGDADATEAHLAELTARPRPESAPVPAGDTIDVHIELDGSAAREWLEHAHWAVDALEAGLLLPGQIPDAVVALMRNYVHRWTAAAMEHTDFVWTSREDAQTLRTMMRYWQPVSQALAHDAHRGTVYFSEAAGRFSGALVNGLLHALATHRDDNADAAHLARTWPDHDPASRPNDHTDTLR